MALEKLQRYARTASKKEVKVLDTLENYYRGEYSLGYVTEKVNMPLRALMEFMQKYELPYYSDSSDAKEGLKRISMIRSTL